MRGGGGDRGIDGGVGHVRQVRQVMLVRQSASDVVRTTL